MPYTHDISGCLSATIGEHGLSEAELANQLGRCAAPLAALTQWQQAGSLPLLELPGRRDDLAEMRDIADDMRGWAEHVVILGTGGSSLGGQTLYALADYGFGPGAGTPRLIFMDNVDPDGFAALAEAVDMSRLGVLVISKSGGTAETLTQFLTMVPWLLAAGGEAALKARAVAITEPGDRPLRRLAQKWDMRVVDHDPAVGGRFSALSVTGMLPAMIAGLDPVAVREGAGEVLERCMAAGSEAANVPSAVGAAVSIGLARHRGAGTTVLLPYLDRLGHFGLWYRQLWAESLGKDGKGTTPIRAMGTVDQHSQLQLYLDGPRDKMFTVLSAAVAASGGVVTPDHAQACGAGYLGGHSMGDLLDAEQRATADTLVRNQRPTRLIGIEALDERCMGALMMHFMLETIIAAGLLGVDAFDQPAVEEGKILAREYLEKMAGAG
ncbi:MAG: glucose-6-phosphate isomerase [Alphaproteobacteria bacterium]